MKTLVTLLKIAMLVTTLSFVMSCDKNNKRSNNTAYGNQLYTYGANGTCINNQNGQPVQLQLCQQQYNNGGGYGSQQCNGNPSLFVWSQANQQMVQQYGSDQSCSTQPYMNGQPYVYGQVVTGPIMCWKSCQTTNCSGQTAYPGGSQSQSQGYMCL